mmetsp:Transcript_42378/g.137504  ORF Transcript_42378/g.137504 Transcript_42378/m.137504 type:complete len:244 (+) Transcript_42378:1033-1764(+)
MRMLATSSSDTSVPIEISAASLSSASTSSARISDKSSPLHFVRTPIFWMVFAYIKLSGTILPISGKCHPYHSFSRIAYVFSSLSRSSSRPMACTIIVSTLSGLNLSLYRESECASPIAMERISAGVAAVTSSSTCDLNPRISSITPSSCTHAMLSFSLMVAPSFASHTARDSFRSKPATFFLRNFFIVALSLPSTRAVADCTASAVSSNFLKALSFTSLRVLSGELKLSLRLSGFLSLPASSS